METVYRAESECSDLAATTTAAWVAEALSRNGWRVTARTGGESPFGGGD